MAKLFAFVIKELAGRGTLRPAKNLKEMRKNT